MFYDMKPQYILILKKKLHTRKYNIIKKTNCDIYPVEQIIKIVFSPAFKRIMFSHSI